MAFYSAEQVAQMYEQGESVCRDLSEVGLTLVHRCAPGIANADAREYLLQGVARRLGTIKACITNVYELFPPDTLHPLQRAVLENLQINLQAFAINVSGVHDNWAWAYLLGQGIKLNPLNIGLFNPRTRPHLTEGMRLYLDNPAIQNWHKTYSKDYRDALAHRIPLYVPPAEFSDADHQAWSNLDAEHWKALLGGRLEEAEELDQKKSAIGKPSYRFVHSMTNGNARPVYLHPQIVCDGLTVVELCKMMIKEWFGEEMA